MTYIIFAAGMLLGFVVSNFVALWMISRRHKESELYGERLFKYHEERNKLISEALLEIKLFTQDWYMKNPTQEDK